MMAPSQNPKYATGDIRQLSNSAQCHADISVAVNGYFDRCQLFAIISPTVTDSQPFMNCIRPRILL